MADVQIIEENTVTELVESVVVVEVVEVAEQGPPGPRGPVGPAGGAAVSRTAGITLSALLAVWEDQDGQVWPLSATDGGHVFCLLGVTLTAAQAGQPVDVQRSGPVDDAAWDWAPRARVYLGANGALTVNPAVGGFHVLVGVALSPTRLLLGIQDPVQLSDD